MITLFNKQTMFEEILFLDGLGRAGKFLLGKIVSNFERVEYFQYVEVLEHYPVLYRLGLMDKLTAGEMMKLSSDAAVYNLAIGRGMNQRQSDGSSITNSIEYDHYVTRSEAADGIQAIEALKRQNRLPSFLVHECLPQAEFLFDIYPSAKIINIQRHPIDIAYSWLMRGWGRRFGHDPLAFVPTINTPEGPAPWFAADWKPEYQNMSEADRVIKSICSLHAMSYQAFQGLAASRKEQVLIISYEDVFGAPAKVIDAISTFVGSNAHPSMDDLLKKEGGISPPTRGLRQQRYSDLTKVVSATLMTELMEVSKEYDSMWSLEKMNEDLYGAN